MAKTKRNKNNKNKMMKKKGKKKATALIYNNLYVGTDIILWL